MNSLSTYWMDHPPMHLTVAMIARGLGAKFGGNKKPQKTISAPNSDKSSHEMTDQDFAEMVSVFGAPVVEIKNG